MTYWDAFTEIWSHIAVLATLLCFLLVVFGFAALFAFGMVFVTDADNRRERTLGVVLLVLLAPYLAFGVPLLRLILDWSITT